MATSLEACYYADWRNASRLGGMNSALSFALETRHPLANICLGFTLQTYTQSHNITSDSSEQTRVSHDDWGQVGYKGWARE